MKRVNFGHKGGFPLEQETLIHLQRAYADDMLEVLFAQWGIEIDKNKNYLVKQATTDEDGWVISTFIRQEINPTSGVAFDVNKPELLRLKYNSAQEIIEVIDVKIKFDDDGKEIKNSDSGYLVYADGPPAKKVYEEFVARYTTIDNKVSNAIREINPNNLIVLKNLISIQDDVKSIKEDYLPRDGSKPMTGTLSLKSAINPLTIPTIPNVVPNSNDDSKTYSQLVIDDASGDVSKSMIKSNAFQKGMIMMWSGNTKDLPLGWELCDGGIDVNGMRIPDLRGRFVVGFDPRKPKEPNNTRVKDVLNYGDIHNTGGHDNVTLDVDELPSHGHSIKDEGHNHNNTDNGDNYDRLMIANEERTFSLDTGHDNVNIDDENQPNLSLAAEIKSSTTGITINTTGGSESHENRPPYYVLAFIIYVGEDFMEYPFTLIFKEGGSGSPFDRVFDFSEGTDFTIQASNTGSTDKQLLFLRQRLSSEAYNDRGAELETSENTYSAYNFNLGTYYFRIFGADGVDNNGDLINPEIISNEIKIEIVG